MSNDDNAHRNLTVGAISLLAGIAITVATGGHVAAVGAIVVGAIEIVIGLSQLGTGSSADPPTTESRKQRREVEDPYATWACPKCSATNKNTEYVCSSCRTSLV
jgi:hypothetical protein